MILNFTKVDKVRLSLEEYTLNTRLMVKGPKKTKPNPKRNKTKEKTVSDFDKKTKTR